MKQASLTVDEYNKLVQSIARPAFNYFMKRIKKEVLDSKEYSKLDLNTFFNALIASMSSVDANLIRWIQNFHKIKTNTDMDDSALRIFYIKNIEDNLEVLKK